MTILRKIYLLSLIGFLLGGVCRAEIAYAGTLKTVNTNGLVGYWKLDESSGTIRDYSSSQNTGSMQGNTVAAASRIVGKFGRAIGTDGVDDYVSIGNGGGLNNLQTGTISMWVKWIGTQDQGNVLDAYGSVLSRQLNGAVSNQIISLNGSNPDTAKITWRPYDAGAGAIISASSPGNGRWRNIVITYSSGNHAMYIDGVLNGTSSLTGTIADVSSIPLVIGAWYGDAGAYSTAHIDQVRIYNRILTSTEIQALAKEKTSSAGVVTNKNAGTANGGLVGQWTFDGKNMTSATATDSVAGNNGTLVGLTAANTAIGKVGQAIRFTGSNYIKLATSTSNTLTSNFTWSYWAKYSVQQTGIAIGWGGSAGYFSALCDCSGPKISFGRRGVAHDVVGSTIISFGKWYHITTTVDGSGNVKIYVNGILDGSGATSLTVPTGMLAISDAGGFPLTATLDDVRIYNRALTAAEVKNLATQAVTANSVANKNAGISGSGGIVGWWTFDGKNLTSATATDSSGVGNDGTRNSTRTAIGKVGQALSFSNADYISVSNAANTQLSNGTVSAWVKTSGCTGDGTYCGIVTKSLAYGLLTAGNAFATYDWTAGVRTSGIRIDDNKWHHLVETFQSGVNNGTYLYLDGVRVLTTTITISSQAYGIEIGRDGPLGATQLWNGLIDDARIYNRVLSPTEVLNLYKLGGGR